MTQFVSIKPKNVKVSYNSRFDKKGTHYNQMISLALSKEQLKEFNEMVMNTILSKNTREYVKTHLKRVAFGDNYLGLTTLEHFVRFFSPLRENRRIQIARNTILRIKEG